MTAKSIMSFRLIKLSPTDRVCDALRIMHTHQIRNLPVVDDDDQFIGLFGIRRMITLLLPKAAQIDFGLKDLNFMPDEEEALYERLGEIGEKPVTDFLEKKKNLLFVKPSTAFPEVLELLQENHDTSLPVIVVKGKKKKLVGMISAWDVLDKLVMHMIADQDGGYQGTSCNDQSEMKDSKVSEYNPLPDNTGKS
jgi:CBS-domain-containing membrane protein